MKTRKRAAKWHLYLVRCRDGTIYTGISTDVARRIEEHELGAGKGAKYLRGRGPLEVVFRKVVGARGRALRLERQIKSLRRRDKERLIAQGRLPVVKPATRRASPEQLRTNRAPPSRRNADCRETSGRG